MKLSKLQLRVIQLMKKGWELGHYEQYREWEHAMLQKGGLGCGEETEDVNINTLMSLRKRGLIVKAKERKNDFSLQRYKLSNKKPLWKEGE